MSRPSITPEGRFAEIVETLAGHPDVTPPAQGKQPKNRFGAHGLKIHNHIFAMLVGGRLVVKLPRPRVDALVAAGEGERFDPGHGRLMKEWLAVGPASGDGWLPLAREALEFVAGRR